MIAFVRFAHPTILSIILFVEYSFLMSQNESNEFDTKYMKKLQREMSKAGQ
jgi:hypothetical protein